ncbi:hypothetical protein CAL26_21120 [Bordetella genomosp. 9]|uniref:Scaffolding protein n=2 Tax=Bordetella genomosp. 9 TaxID=1416803 RepID=A0A261R4V7_9BORD|nr:hypothetical protein CAL26_21120 [Bordetella genomosp. 9]
MQQAMEGNFAPLRALLAEKQIPGGEAYIALAESGYAEYKAGQDAKTQAVQQIVLNAAGDEQAWNEVLDWARANAEEHERAAVNYAFDQGGILAEAMAQYLVGAYRAQPGVSTPQQGSPATSTAAARPAATDAGPLSPKDFAAKSRELRHKLGPDFESSPEYARVVQRRNAWRG